MYAAYNFQYLLNVFMARQVINAPIYIYIMTLILYSCIIFVYTSYIMSDIGDLCIPIPFLSSPSFRNCLIKKFKKLNMPDLRWSSNILKAGTTDKC